MIAEGGKGVWGELTKTQEQKMKANIVSLIYALSSPSS